VTPPRSFEALVEALASEVVEADAAFQLRQRLAWKQMAGGAVTPVEGFDRLANLAVREASFRFRMEPVPLPWYARLWAALTGRLSPARPSFRFARGGRERPDAFDVTVRVGRGEGGGWETVTEGAGWLQA